jgi:hypothetical protein
MAGGEMSASLIHSEQNSTPTLKSASRTCKYRGLQTPIKLGGGSNALRSFRHRLQHPLGILIVSPPIQQPPVLGLAHPAPLLKKERHALCPTKPGDRRDVPPFFRARTALCTLCKDTNL